MPNATLFPPTRRGRVRPARCLTALAILPALVTLTASRGGAQERLAARHAFSATTMAETWSFGDGLLQTTLRGDTVRLSRATRLSVPIGGDVQLGDRWRLGIGAALVNGRVTLAAPDDAGGAKEYELSGVTDVKLTLTAQVVPDHVLVTAGFNVRPGGTSLDPGELEAVRVFAAPALGFEVPSMGLGRAATAGVVLARQLAGWSWAFGGSYEMRSGSTPLIVTSGLPALDFNPSDAVHLSLGAEGLVGPHAMTAGLSADLFSDDEYASGDQEITGARTRLGPIVTAEWQLRVATPRLRELVLYATDRYRSRYSRGGTKVDESSANYIDLGANAVAPVGRSVGVVAGLALRHQTGLQADSSVASAAARLAAITLGVRYDRGNYTLQPFVRTQFGRVDTYRASASAREIVGGVSLTTRF